MPHDHLLKIKHLVAVVICLLLVSQAVSGTITSAQSGTTVPAQDPETWSEPTALSNPDEPADSDRPDIAVCADGTVYVVWEQDDKIWYRVYRPSAGWNEASPILPGLNARGSEPAIAVSSDCVLHLVWSKLWWDNSEIIYTFNDGNGFVTTTAKVSRTETQSFQPDVAVDSNGEPRVVWVEAVSGYKLYEGKPIPGLSGYWNTGPVSVSGSEGQVPDLAVDREGLSHLTWMYADNPSSPPDIFYKWQEQVDKWPGWSKNVSDTSRSVSKLPDIAIGSGKAVIVWQETVDDDDEVYVTWRQLDSNNFASINLSNTDVSSRSPAVTADGLGNFFVAWEEKNPVEAIWTRPWPGIGNWWAVHEIPNGGTKVKQPAVAASPRDSHVYAVWAQKDGPEDTWDIYFSDMQLEAYRSHLPLIMKNWP